MNLKGPFLNTPFFLFFILTVGSNQSCSQSTNATIKSEFPRQVGDISFDPKLDDPSFRICDSANVYQYYTFFNGLEYDGEKTAIVNHFQRGYNPESHPGQSGFLTIRFLVNCKGETDRYRIYSQVDELLNPKSFSNALLEQIMKLTRQLDGWKIAKYEGTDWDYYQYITFHFNNGQITTISP